MKNNIKIDGTRTDLKVVVDDELLFERVGIFGNWVYIHVVDNKKINECLPKFDESYFDIFLDDIKEQLKNGIDKNNLSIHIPKKIETIKCGEKIIQIEI